MPYKHINPGLIGLLTERAASTTQADVYTRTGFSMNFDERYPVNRIAVPNLQEIYVQFDMAFSSVGGSDQYICCVDYLAYNNNSVNVYRNGRDFRMYRYTNGSGARIGDPIASLETGQLNRYMIHVVSDKSSGLFEVWQNNNLIGTYAGNTLNGNPITFVSFGSGGAYVSNLMISDEPISYYERAVIMPVAETVTDWTQEGDMYTATASGQSLLQTVDKSLLKTQIGANANIVSVQPTGTAFVNGGELTIKAQDSDGNDYPAPIEKADAIWIPALSVNCTIDDLPTSIGWKVE